MRESPHGTIPHTGLEDVRKDTTQAAFERLRALEHAHPRRAPRLYRAFRQTLGIVAAVDETAKVLAQG